MWIHTKKKSVDFFRKSQGKKDHWHVIPCGAISDEKWSRTHIYKKVMVTRVVRNGSNSCLNVDTNLSTDLSTRSIDDGGYRSIKIHLLENTVDIYGRYLRSMPIHLQRKTVDGPLKIEIILWSIYRRHLQPVQVLELQNLLWTWARICKRWCRGACSYGSLPESCADQITELSMNNLLNTKVW